MDELRPICSRLEVVGSMKRADHDALTNGVHDIEFILIQQSGIPRAEFGKPKNIYLTKLDKLLADLEYRGRVRQAADKKDGQRYKKRAIIGTGELNEFCVEFFIAQAENWALLNAIRTGDELFAHRFVTNRNKHFFSDKHQRDFPGLLPNDLTYVRGVNRDNGISVIERLGEVLDLKTEGDAINLIGAGRIPPNERAEFALR
jgi:hypothetical protein